MAVNRRELDQFKTSLDVLCQAFHIFIKNKTIRRESPTSPDFYYELELSVKVKSNGKGTPDFNDAEIQDLIEQGRSKAPIDK